MAPLFWLAICGFIPIIPPMQHWRYLYFVPSCATEVRHLRYYYYYYYLVPIVTFILCAFTIIEARKQLEKNQDIFHICIEMLHIHSTNTLILPDLFLALSNLLTTRTQSSLSLFTPFSWVSRCWQPGLLSTSHVSITSLCSLSHVWSLPLTTVIIII